MHAKVGSGKKGKGVRQQTMDSCVFNRHGGRPRRPFSAQRGGPPQGALTELEEDASLQTPGGLQDHVARIEEAVQVQSDL